MGAITVTVTLPGFSAAGPHFGLPHFAHWSRLFHPLREATLHKGHEESVTNWNETPLSTSAKARIFLKSCYKRWNIWISHGAKQALHILLARKFTVMKQITLGIFYLILRDQCKNKTFGVCNSEVSAATFLPWVLHKDLGGYFYYTVKLNQYGLYYLACGSCLHEVFWPQCISACHLASEWLPSADRRERNQHGRGSHAACI